MATCYCGTIYCQGEKCNTSEYELLKARAEIKRLQIRCESAYKSGYQEQYFQPLVITERTHEEEVRKAIQKKEPPPVRSKFIHESGKIIVKTFGDVDEYWKRFDRGGF